MILKSIFVCLLLGSVIVVRGQRTRPRLPQRPDGHYLPPKNNTTPDESEEDIQPGGYTPAPTTTLRPTVPNESEEDIQPGGYTPAPTTTAKTTTPPPRKAAPPPVKQPPRPPPPPPPKEEDEKIDAAGNKPEGGSWGGGAFDFAYGVKDDLTKNDYSHTQKSDGDVVTGEYRTLMSDGRVQVVTYTADWKNGYRAMIKYY